MPVADQWRIHNVWLLGRDVAKYRAVGDDDSTSGCSEITPSLDRAMGMSTRSSFIHRLSCLNCQHFLNVPFLSTRNAWLGGFRQHARRYCIVVTACSCAD